MQLARLGITQQDGDPHLGLNHLDLFGDRTQNRFQSLTAEQAVEGGDPRLLHLFRLFLRGDVVPCAECLTPALSVCRQQLQLIAHPMDSACLVQEAVVMLHELLFVQFRHGAQRASPVIRMQMSQPPVGPQRLLLRVAEQALDVGADPGGGGGPVAQLQRIQDDRAGLQHVRQVPRGLLHDGLFAQQFRLAVNLLQDRRKFMQVAGVLGDVVVDTELKRTRSHLLAPLAGHDDDRDAQAAFVADRAHRVERIDAGQAIVQ